MIDRVGQTLAGRYRLLRLLGAGGMGTVYLAEHVHLGRHTAIKLLHAEFGLNADAESRFRREALLAAKISHPSVAQIYDFDRTADGEFLIAMEYVEGETVAQRLRSAGPFRIEEALRVLDGVAEGLDRAHALGILHRDLKPENLMLTASGAVKLLDFGIARDIDTTSGVTSSGIAVGTPGYMSPEQLVGEPLGPASDIYALGVVVYEMLTGQRPHTGANFAELRARRLTQPPVPVRRLRAECGAVLSDVVGRALEVDPQLRWASGTAFARAATAALAAPAPPVMSHDDSAVDPADRWEAHFEALRLAGRGREVRLVREAWAAARAGRTHVLWIEGDEGAGKSSFLAQAQREAAADSAIELVARGYEAHVGRPFGAWIPALRIALERWGRGARPWPAIEALTDARADTPIPAGAVLYDEIEALLCAGTARAPLIVVIDDVDWCDSASLGLLEFLVHSLPDARLLIAVTSVSEAASTRRVAADLRERLRRRERVVWIGLRPLSYDAVAGWLARALGREPPDEMVRFVYGHTEGNAFFIEQVMRSLIDRGRIDRLTEDTVRVQLADEPPPEAVADVVRRRLRGMSPAAREILQYAAAIGREFEVDLVLELSARSEDAVLDALDEAVAAGVLAPVRAAGGDWYRFTHNKHAQVLEQALNSRRRRQLHGRIAAALRARPDTPPAAIAWHWYHAGELAHATSAARAAAERAIAVHDFDAALTFAALGAETAKTVEERCNAHELRGDALWHLDRPGEAAAAYAHARMAAAQDDVASRLRRKELRAALRAGTVSADVVVAEAGRLLQAPSVSPDATHAALELLLAEASLDAGDLGAAAAAASRTREAAIRTGEGSGSQALDCVLLLARAALRNTDLARAEALAGEATSIASALGDPLGLARSSALRGSVAVALGDSAAARIALSDGLERAERARFTRLARQLRESIASLDQAAAPTYTSVKPEPRTSAAPS